MFGKRMVILLLCCLTFQACWALGEIFHAHDRIVVDEVSTSHHGEEALRLSGADSSPSGESTLGDHHHSCASHSPIGNHPGALLTGSLARGSTRFYYAPRAHLLFVSNRLEKPNWHFSAR